MATIPNWSTNASFDERQRTTTNDTNHTNDDSSIRTIRDIRGSSFSGSGWGKLEGWTPERFDAAIEAPPKSKERRQLVGKLVEHIFTAFRGIAQGKDEAYVDLDEGLAIISEHAKTLGYATCTADEMIVSVAKRMGQQDFSQLPVYKDGRLVAVLTADRRQWIKASHSPPQESKPD